MTLRRLLPCLLLTLLLPWAPAVAEPLSPGEIVVAEVATNTLRRISADGLTSSIFFSGLAGPRGLAIEASGGVVVVEYDGGRVRRIAADGLSSSVIMSGFDFPTAVAIAANGDLVIKEGGVSTLRRLWRIAPDGSAASLVHSGIGSEDVEVDSIGNYIVASDGTNQILKVTPAGAVSVLFGPVAFPSDLAIEPGGTIVVAEFSAGTLRRIAADGSSAAVIFSGLNAVEGLLIVENGDFLVAELALGQLRRITPDGSSSSIFFTGLNAPDHLAIVGAREVAIDIKPGGSQNSINFRSQGTLVVAILSDTGFDAPTQVDLSSLTFGRTGDEHSLERCHHPKDVNDDLRLDLVCHFSVRAAAFQRGDTVGILKGKTVSGTPFKGVDSVRIVP